MLHLHPGGLIKHQLNDDIWQGLSCGSDQAKTLDRTCEGGSWRNLPTKYAHEARVCAQQGGTPVCFILANKKKIIFAASTASCWDLLRRYQPPLV